MARPRSADLRAKRNPRQLSRTSRLQSRGIQQSESWKLPQAKIGTLLEERAVGVDASVVVADGEAVRTTVRIGPSRRPKPSESRKRLQLRAARRVWPQRLGGHAQISVRPPDTRQSSCRENRSLSIATGHHSLRRSSNKEVQPKNAPAWNKARRRLNLTRFITKHMASLHLLPKWLQGSRMRKRKRQKPRPATRSATNWRAQASRAGSLPLPGRNLRRPKLRQPGRLRTWLPGRRTRKKTWWRTSQKLKFTRAHSKLPARILNTQRNQSPHRRRTCNVTPLLPKRLRAVPSNMKFWKMRR